jgi:hypothetical protein
MHFLSEASPTRLSPKEEIRASDCGMLSIFQQKATYTSICSPWLLDMPRWLSGKTQSSLSPIDDCGQTNISERWKISPSKWHTERS